MNKTAPMSRVIFQEAPHDFRTEIPNIVLEMLKDGELSSSDFTLYCVYRRIAGENGACWVGTRGLAERSGLKTNTVTDAKKRLSLPFQKLNGMSLITISPGDKKKEEADLVQINDLWFINHDFFKNKLTCPKRDYTPVVKEITPLSQKGLQKKEPYKKEPYKKSSSSLNSLPEETNQPVIDDALPAADDDSCGAVNKIPKEVPKKQDPGIKEKTSLREPDIEYSKTNGQKLVISQSDVYRHFAKLPYHTDIVKAAIARLRSFSMAINNPLKYLESICQSIEQENNRKSAKDSLKKTENPPKADTPKTKEVTVNFGDLMKQRGMRGFNKTDDKV